MKKRSLLLFALTALSLSACGSNNKNKDPYTEPAKDINSMADFEKMVSDNPINSSSSKTPTRYSLNVDLNFKNASTQYQIKDVELIGNKHRLYNFSISVTNHGGLFSKVNNCIFSDLTITNATVIGNYSGALVGSAEIAIFKNIKIGDHVTVGDEVYQQVGGVVGYAENAEIRNCTNNAKVKGRNNVGGIVGHAYNTDILSCTNNGEINAGYSGTGIGGVCGTYTNYWRYEAREDTFQLNKNYGDVLASECDEVGGLIGQHHPQLYLRGTKYPKVTIAKCYNYGDVEGKDQVGGVAGSGICDLCDTLFSECFNYASVTGKNYVGGIAGYTKDFSVSTAYTQGDELKQVNFTKCESKLNNNKDNFVKGEMYVGGIAGNGTQFINCKNYIDVITIESESPEVNASYLPHEYQHSIGGIVGLGYAEFDLAEVKFESCINEGHVQGVEKEDPYYQASSLGGICGFSYGGLFSKCTNNGELNANQCVGGLIGSLEPHQETYIQDCHSNGNIIAYRCVGGIVGDIEASEENYEIISISSTHVNILEAFIYGTTTSDELEPYKFVLGGLIGRATSTATADNYYRIGNLGSYSVNFKYHSPSGETNMKIDRVIGYNKTNANSKKLILYNETDALENASIERIEDE